MIFHDFSLILPGGLGTFSEIFNLIEEYRLDNKKKIIIYNLDGYYDDLINIMNKLYETKFASIKVDDYLNIFDNREDIIGFIKEEL